MIPRIGHFTLGQSETQHLLTAVFSEVLDQLTNTKVRLYAVDKLNKNSVSPEALLSIIEYYFNLCCSTGLITQKYYE